MTNAYITDIGRFLPNQAVANDDVERVLGLVGGKVSRARRLTLRNNGIHTRYYAIDPQTGKFTHNNAQLTAAAVRALFVKSGLRAHDIATLCCGTSSPDQIKPAHAHMVHGELGGPPCEVVSTAGVCTAGVAALKFAYMSVAAGLARNAISTASEIASTFMHAMNFAAEVEARVANLDTGADARPELAFEKDFLRWMLSDGAGAMLIKSEPNPDRLSLRIDWMEAMSFAGELEPCMYSGAVKLNNGKLQGWRHAGDPSDVWRDSYFAVKQDARLLNEHIVSTTVERALAALIAKRDLRADAVDWFLPHYSSEFFRPKLLAGLQNAGFPIPYERWFTNLSEVGNVGSASIYLIMEELFYSGRLKRGERILCYVPESARFSVCYFHLTVV